MNNSENHLEIILKTHEKTINYAFTLVSEGELLSGKSILDQTLKKLNWMEIDQNNRNLIA